MAETGSLELHLGDRFPLRRFLRDLLAKRWMESIVPFCLMVSVLISVAYFVPGYFKVSNLTDVSQQFAEIGLVTIACAIIIMSGGIDLSVGSNFAISSIVALYCIHIFALPVGLVTMIIIITGALMGSLNGFFIGYLRLRAFMVTLVSLIVLRGAYELVFNAQANKLAMAFNDSSAWEFLGYGNVLGIPVPMVCLLLIAAILHILMSRSRWGWHIKAIGGARQAARQAGIPLKRTIFFTYVFCGALTGVAALLHSARLNSVDEFTGVGLEFKVITAAILGGVALGGGKGSVARALFGIIIVFITLNALVHLYVPGDIHNILLGIILVAAVGIETKWLKNKYRAMGSLLVNPAFLGYSQCPELIGDSDSIFALNDRLRKAESIGLGLVDGPEDVILDRKGRLYCGSREGVIHRFSDHNFSRKEEFARTGGYPLGMAFDRDDNLIVCVGGMGLYGVRPNGEVYKLSDRTKRTWWMLKDDSNLIHADDLDIAPDGKIYFSDFSVRFETRDWAIDSLEGRGNGRLLCYDPATGKTHIIKRNLFGANGVCVPKDGKSVLIAQTWACNVIRHWLAGPKRGNTEPVIENLPGYPDNINRASDGNYWVALVAMRTPTLDLAMRMPGFRRRMTKRIPPDDWLVPNFNNGCVFKMSAEGEVLDVFWDKGARSLPAITSMREHRGWLYLGGVFNNRIGRIRLDGVNPEWMGPDDYWGKK